MEQRVHRHAHGRVGDADGGARIGAVDAIADAHAGGDVIWRRAEHHELAAAVVDEMVQRENRDARRLEPHANRMRGRRGERPQVVEHLALGVDENATFARFEIGISLRVAGTISRTRSGPSCLSVPAPCCPRVKSGVCLPPCSKATSSRDSCPAGVSIVTSTVAP